MSPDEQVSFIKGGTVKTLARRPHIVMSERQRHDEGKRLTAFVYDRGFVLRIGAMTVGPDGGFVESGDPIVQLWAFPWKPTAEAVMQRAGLAFIGVTIPTRDLDDAEAVMEAGNRGLAEIVEQLRRLPWSA